eukprot:11578619-Ditylum_brightwellii.AAC.1
MQRAVVPHAVARNPYETMHRWSTSLPTRAIVPYASAHMSHASQQKVSKHPNTASTNEYVPVHRWSTSPPVPVPYLPHLSAPTNSTRPI